MADFDEKYVKQLRDEAAGWRTKYRELEAQGLYKDVEVELAKRNIKADPTWVEVKEGQTISQAVDSLVEQHPHLASAPAPTPTNEKVTPEVRRPQAPRAMSTGTHSHSDTPDNPMRDRSLDEIKKDPVARAKLRDLYRGLLEKSSNQPKFEY